MCRAFCCEQKTQLPISHSAPVTFAVLPISSRTVWYLVFLLHFLHLGSDNDETRGGRPWSWGEDDLIHVLHCQPWLPITWSRYLQYWKSESTQKTIWPKQIWSTATAKMQPYCIDPCSSNIVTVCHSFVIPSRTCSFWFEYGQPDLKRAASLICSCLSWHSSFAGMIESGGKLVTLWLRWLLFQDVRESKWLANNLGTSCWERDPSLSSQRLSLWQHTEWNLILQRIWQAEILLASVWVWTMDPQISFDKMSME